MAAIGALHQDVHLVSAHQEMIVVVGVDGGWIEILTILAGCHVVFGPVHAAVRGRPEAQSRSANAALEKGGSRGVRGRDATGAIADRLAVRSGVDGPVPGEAVVHRFPDAVTVELRVHLCWVERVHHDRQRSVVAAPQRRVEIDRSWASRSSTPPARSCRPRCTDSAASRWRYLLLPQRRPCPPIRHSRCLRCHLCPCRPSRRHCLSRPLRWPRRWMCRHRSPAIRRSMCRHRSPAIRRRLARRHSHHRKVSRHRYRYKLRPTPPTPR